MTTNLDLANFRPLLSGAVKQDSDLAKLNYPIFASPKLDGIRTLIHPELGPVTRKLKSVPNKHAFNYMNELFKRGVPSMAGLDGELTYGAPESRCAPDVFNQTQSALMSHQGSHHFTFWAFDSFFDPNITYNERFGFVRTYVLPEIEKVQDPGGLNGPWIRFLALETRICENAKDILDYEQTCLQKGFEGIMLRDPLKHYKFGRSAITKTQQHLVKLKRTTDAEAIIIGFEELEHNRNCTVFDALGLTDRSSAKAGKVAGDTLGAIVCEAITGDYKGRTFKIGTGFDQALRSEIWQNRAKYLHATVSFVYQDIGAKDAPRFPVFKGFRHITDIVDCE